MKQLWTPWRMSYLETLNEHSEGCIFCTKVEAADEAEFVLRRGETSYACLNLFPYNCGHTLVVPYDHVLSIEGVAPACLLEMMTLCQQSLAVLRQAYRPRGFNVGFNLGDAGGAGLPEHFHLHVVPRWIGDSNFMSVVGEIRLLPELLEDTWRRLRTRWDQEFPLPSSSRRVIASTGEGAEEQPSSAESKPSPRDSG